MVAIRGCAIAMAGLAVGSNGIGSACCPPETSNVRFGDYGTAILSYCFANGKVTAKDDMGCKSS